MVLEWAEETERDLASIEEEGCQLVGFDGGKNDMPGRKRRLDLVIIRQERKMLIIWDLCNFFQSSFYQMRVCDRGNLNRGPL